MSTPSINPDVLKQKLEYMAFRMLTDNIGTSTPIQWAKHHIGEPFIQAALDSGVLIQSGDLVRFRHPSVHGHFAAPGLRRVLSWQLRDSLTFFLASVLRVFGVVLVVILYLFFFLPVVFLTYILPNPIARYLDKGFKVVASVLNDQDEIIPETRRKLRSRRRRFIQHLNRLGADAAPAVPALTECLNDRDADVRATAAWALGNLGASAAPAVPTLIKLLSDRQKVFSKYGAEVCEEVVEALEKIPTPEAFQAAYRWRQENKPLFDDDDDYYVR